MLISDIWRANYRVEHARIPGHFGFMVSEFNEYGRTICIVRWDKTGERETLPVTALKAAPMPFWASLPGVR